MNLLCNDNQKHKHTFMRAGMSLVELIIASAILVIVALMLYEGITSIFEAVRLSRVKTIATSIANEQFELIRNLPYNQVGIVGGVPSGPMPRFQTFVRNGITFYATTSIQNIDNPFDGTATSTATSTKDTAPADYKQIEIEMRCAPCDPYDALTFTALVSAKGLESSTNNGSLFIRVFDANGQAVPDANVTIVNTSVNPQINMTETTNLDGMFQLVDTPTSTEGYYISVTKPGYSLDRTYARGSIGSSTPASVHASVVKTQLSQKSFAIDRLSDLTVSTLDNQCDPLGSITVHASGTKKIGTLPDKLKFTQTFNTNGAGKYTFDGIEWDTYDFRVGSGYVVAGTIPLLPLAVAPDTDNALSLILETSSTHSLLVSVRDSGTELPISGAVVRIQKTGTDISKTSGQGYVGQTDWSGGAGQANYTDTTKYFASDGNVEVNNPAGTMVLKQTLGQYVNSGWLESSTFDVGTTSNFYTIAFNPNSQVAQVGANAVRLQIAATNDAATTTWNYIGPDGTSGSYYTSSGQTIGLQTSGNQYVRYKVFMQTANTSYTPTISDVSLTYSTQCTPPGQVFFRGITSGTYDITVTVNGYQTYAGQVTVSGASKALISLTP